MVHSTQVKLWVSKIGSFHLNHGITILIVKSVNYIFKVLLGEVFRGIDVACLLR